MPKQDYYPSQRIGKTDTHRYVVVPYGPCWRWEYWFCWNTKGQGFAESKAGARRLALAYKKLWVRHGKQAKKAVCRKRKAR